MTRGDHLFIKRRGYYHHGIDLGIGHIIHFSEKPGKGKIAAHIRQTTMTEFTCGKKAKLREYGTSFPPEEIVARAESKLGTADYDLFGRHCEHFATWCAVGLHSSSQINGVRAATGLVAATASAAVAGVGVVSGIGAAAGLSGAGVMSGLATAGTVVGGTAVGGLGVLGAIPGTAGVLIMRAALPDGDHLSTRERVRPDQSAEQRQSPVPPEGRSQVWEPSGP